MLVFGLNDSEHDTLYMIYMSSSIDCSLSVHFVMALIQVTVPLPDF